MSTSYWDPVSESYLHYDYGTSCWCYPDGKKFDQNLSTASGSSRKTVAQQSTTSQGRLHTNDLESDTVQGYQPESSFGLHDSSYTHEIVDTPASDITVERSVQALNQWGDLQREPKDAVTDPSLYAKGYVSRGRIRATPGKVDVLDREFMRQVNPKIFFVAGKIFRILWPEPPGYVAGSNETAITDTGRLDTTMHVKFRWFIVVKEGSNFCSCLPISTYGRRGVSKPSLQKWQHSVIYSSKAEPSLLPGEEPGEGEEGMMSPIKAVPRRSGDSLNKASRIDYSRIYTVDHYVKVKEWGDVQKSDIRRLRKQWWTVVKKSIEDDVADEGDDENDSENASENNVATSSEGEAGLDSQYLEWVTAKYQYNDPKMMQLREGDRIGVLDIVTDHWWQGRNLRTNEVNLFPAQYVDRSAEPENQLRPSPASNRSEDHGLDFETTFGIDEALQQEPLKADGSFRMDEQFKSNLLETESAFESQDSLDRGKAHVDSMGDLELPASSVGGGDHNDLDLSDQLSETQNKDAAPGVSPAFDTPRPMSEHAQNAMSDATISFRGSVASLPFSRWSDSTIAADDFIAHELAEFLWLDTECQGLSQAGVNNPEIGKERFQRNFRRLLKRFARDLSYEAAGKSDHAAASFVRYAATAAACEVTFRAIQMQDETEPLDSGTVRVRPRQDDQSDSEHEDLTFDEPNEDHHDVAEAKRFFSSSYALESFRRGLREFVFPSFSTILTTLVKKRLSKLEDPPASEMFQFLGEIQDALPRTIRYSRERVGVLDRLMDATERKTGEEWDWWPMQPPKVPSTATSVRVTWRSAFGNSRWKNIPSAFVPDVDTAVAEYMNMINTSSTENDHVEHLDQLKADSNLSRLYEASSPKSSRAHILWSRLRRWQTTAKAENKQPVDQPHAENAPDQTAAGSQGSVDATSSSAQSGHGIYSITSDSDSGSASSSTIRSSPSSTSQVSSHPAVAKASRVLVLVNNTFSEGYQLFQIKVPKSMETKEFFEQLRRKYRKRRGFWAWFSVWRYHHCDFYSSERFCPERFALKQKGHLPPETHHDYRICDQARDKHPAPPISTEEFYERFYASNGTGFLRKLSLSLKEPRKGTAKDPERGSTLNSSGRLDRLVYLPQKLSKFYKSDETLEGFWNLVAKEKISFLWVVVWNLVCVSPGLIFFFLYVFKFSHARDLQTAAIPVTMILANLTLFWMLFLASLSGHT